MAANGDEKDQDYIDARAKLSPHWRERIETLKHYRRVGSTVSPTPWPDEPEVVEAARERKSIKEIRAQRAKRGELLD
jgi:NADPH-dependent ferric siderophore reductase